MHAVTARALADPGSEVILRRLFGGRLRIGAGAADGRLEIEVDGPSPEVLASQLAGLGAQIEVLGPPRTKARLAELAAELVSVYGAPDAEWTAGATSEPAG